MHLRRLHIVIGLLALAAFLLSGQYMHWGLGHLQDLPDAPRMVYRATHIYLLFAGLCNLALGLYLQAAETRLARATQWIGGALLLAAPALLAGSFWWELPPAELERPLRHLGVFASFGGVLLHAAAAWLAARGRTRARAAATE